MNLSRRQALGSGGAFMIISLLPIKGAIALSDEVQEIIDEFTAGSVPSEGGIILDVDEIAENGAAVPIGVEAEGASSIMVVAPNNPNKKVIQFNFLELSGKSRAATRIRLAETQDLIVVAKMKDGSFRQIAKNVKVTIGGCA